MTGLPGQRTHNLAEMQLMSQAAAQRAAQRVVVLEGTITTLQGQLNQMQMTVLELLDSMQQQSAAISGMMARVGNLEGEQSSAYGQRLEDIDTLTLGIERRLEALEAKPKRGRPKGSKNKPKLQPEGEKAETDLGENTAQAGDSSNPEASDT
ncbi:MAG: hypothetical protein ACR2RF_32260 [Geminicoccaceae bacterium]